MPPRALGVTDADRHVARRLRERRISLGMSQQRLARAVGVTFQQVQKYENGSNRISAGMLYELAAALAVPVAHFYDGLDEAAPPPRRSRLELDMMRTFHDLPPGVQREVYTFVNNLQRECALVAERREERGDAA